MRVVCLFLVAMLGIAAAQPALDQLMGMSGGGPMGGLDGIMGMAGGAPMGGLDGIMGMAGGNPMGGLGDMMSMAGDWKKYSRMFGGKGKKRGYDWQGFMKSGMAMGGAGGIMGDKDIMGAGKDWL